MRKFLRGIEFASVYIGGHVSGWIVVLMMLLVLVEVISRYIMRNALAVSDEFSAYMLVAVCFLGLAYVTRENSHIRITAAVDRLPKRLQDRLRLVTLSLSAIFYVLLTVACFQLLAYTIDHGARSGSWIRTPLIYPQIFMPIGAILICLQLIVEISKVVRVVRNKEEKA